MYQTDLTEIEWKYITKVLNLQERKRKYNLECHFLFGEDRLSMAYAPS